MKVSATITFVALLCACQAQEVTKAVFAQKRLYRLYDDSTVSVWDPVARKEDEQQRKFIQSFAPLGIDGRSDMLYILGAKTINTVSDGKVASTYSVKGGGFEKPPLNFITLLKHSYAIFPDGIRDLTSGKQFLLPEMGGQLRRSFLRPLCYAVGSRKIWIGNGYGEWGGFLVSFDVIDRKWAWNYDSLHYVTGVALVGDTPQLVTWSMSHFMTTAVLRKHVDDAQVAKSYEEYQDRYFQTATYSEFDRKFYVVEQHVLNVCDSDGRLTKVVDIPKRPYRGEGMAVGVVPGVQSLVPISDDTIIVVFASGEPTVVKGNKVLE